MKIESYRASHAGSWSTISIRLSDDRLRCVKESANPRFLPLENVHTGMANSFEIFSTSLNSSTFLGRTAALGILRVPSASCNSYGSIYSVKASPWYTCASPTILLYLLIAVSNASLSIPGGNTDFSGTVTESLNRIVVVDNLWNGSWTGLLQTGGRPAGLTHQPTSDPPPAWYNRSTMLNVRNAAGSR
ncbi:FAD-linked oxidase-like protein [Alternaria alternata]|nr:FAD-linked oxidase-like protein [Alternaria alternata]